MLTGLRMDQYPDSDDLNNNENNNNNNNNNNVECSSSNEDIDDVTTSAAIAQWIGLQDHEINTRSSRVRDDVGSISASNVLSTVCTNQSDNYRTPGCANLPIIRHMLCRQGKLHLENGDELQGTCSSASGQSNNSLAQVDVVSSSVVWEASEKNTLVVSPSRTIHQSVSSSDLSPPKVEPLVQYRRAKSSPACSSCLNGAHRTQESTRRRGYSITSLDSSFSDLPSAPESPCSEVPNIRSTMTSKMRFELRHGTHGQDADEVALAYLTPTQRKDQQIKDLRLHVKELTRMLNEKERDEDDEKHHAGKVLATLEGEIEQLVREVASLREENKKLKHAQSDSTSALNDMVEKMKRLEETMLEREKDHETMFLKMYNKGMRMAQIQRQEEIEDLVNKGVPSQKFHVQELIQKLALTETELGKWQALRLAETYKNAQTPETEAETTLRFLRDSCFHYLTDPKMADDHLRAMIHIFDFTDSQKGKIASAMTEKRKKRK